ncbi:hypothetical protein [Paenibacillus chungangensis]|uniref:Uncharacterized protein n=1 Tax=Paenibacillus chungangensis TaxID=696535 RepID=A0ABW3HTR8_9BACL
MRNKPNNHERSSESIIYAIGAFTGSNAPETGLLRMGGRLGSVAA